ncbi:uncharacterized protein LOC144441193 [Glandiceps talaboti]
MVSIPDWSKFARLTGSPTKPANFEAKLEKIRQEKFYREAEEKGYLQTLSKNFLRENCVKDKEKESLRSIKLVKLVGVHLRDIVGIYTCKRLQICILHSNYISRFDALIACPELIKLDLHSNQISVLPGAEFWENLEYLRILHLHNNSIGRLEHLQSLAHCPSLEVLTLFDTPVSLKKAYRHHVVNSVWTLRVLDMHVVSDEEIIEDAAFGGPFTAMNPNFYIDLMPTTKKETTYELEMKIVHYILGQISHIQARYSPVLIIQRYIRGYLARKRFGLIQDTRIWAAVSIQRKYRDYKGLSKPEPGPPPTSPLPGTSVDDSSSMRIDFDTYMQNRRPGSRTPSLASAHGERVPTRPSKVQSPIKEENLQVRSQSSTKLGAMSQSPHRRRTNLLINLSRLESDGILTLQDDVAIETTFPSKSFRSSRDEPIDMIKSARSVGKKGKKKKKERKTVKQMLGPLRELDVPVSDHGEDLDLDDESSRKVVFRLKGMKPLVVDTDPLQDMLISRREAARDVKEAERAYIMKRESLPKPTLPPKKKHNADQRLFSRVQGTMGMSSLRAVQQAYKDRQDAEKMAAKMDFVMALREQREHAKNRIRGYLDEKRAVAQQQHEREVNKMADMLEKQEIIRKEEIQQNREMRSRSSEFKQRRHTDSLFLTDFNSQHTSVSNALLRHDRQAKREDIFHERQDLLQGLKDSQRQQQDLVKKYLEHRKLMRQAHAAVERATLDTRLLHETNEKMMEARSRVTQQKQKTKTVQAFYPLPKSASSLSVPKTENTKKKDTNLDRFHTMMNSQDGRVGNHPTLVK